MLRGVIVILALGWGIASAAEPPCDHPPPRPLVDANLDIVRQYELARPATSALAERVWLRSGERVLISQSGCAPATITYAFPLGEDTPVDSLAVTAVTALAPLVDVVPTAASELMTALEALAQRAPQAREVQLASGDERLRLSLVEAPGAVDLVLVHEIDR